MKVSAETSLRDTVQSLWKRAPLWRFSLMSASLLTLLFALFPPAPPQPGDDSLQQPYPTAASYTPQATAGPDLPSQQNPATTAANAPKTADLSLATPGSAESDSIREETGIDPAVLGHLYSGSLKMGGYDVSLPAGHWIMLASLKMNGPKASGMAYFLGRVKHKRLIAGLVVHAVRAKPDEEMGLLRNMKAMKPLFKSPECVSEDAPHACWILYGLFTSQWEQWGNRNVKMDNLTRAAVGSMTAKGISYPQDLIIVQFMRGEKWGFLEALYSFNPEADHIVTSDAASTADTEWAPVNIKHYPEKVAYIEKLKQWGASFWPHFNEAFEAGH
jgi:hypothetical protein